MFHFERSSNGPATASHLNTTWLTITGKDQWISASATVYSSASTYLPQAVSSEVGHYHVIYSYWVNSTIYTDKFVDYGMQDECYLRRNEELEICYNPRNPSQSYYPGLRTMTNFHLISAAVSAGMGIVALLLVSLSRHHQN